MATESGWRPLRVPAAHDAHRATTPFHRLAVAHVLALAGDALVTVALAGSLFFDISPTAARGRVALSLVLTIAPFAVVAPFLGPAIDRISGGRRLMLMGACVGRAVAALLAARVLDGLLLFPVAFVLLVLSKTHAVAKSSLVPAVVADKGELVGANARLSLAGALVSTVAALPGVLVMELAGAEWVMRLAAVTFAAGAVAALRIVQVRHDEARDAEVAQVELHDPTIRLAATSMGVLRGAVGFLTFLVAFALRRAGEPAWVFGLVLAASIAGSLVASLVAPHLRRRLVEEHLLAGALLLVVASALAAVRIGGRPAAALAAAALAVAAGAGKLAFDSLVQRDAPHAAHGRSFARFEAVFQLAWVGGALLPVALPVPIAAGYLLLAAAATVAVGTNLAGLRAHRRREALGL